LAPLRVIESRSERCHYRFSSLSSPPNRCLHTTLGSRPPSQFALVALVRLTPKLSSRQLPRCIWERWEWDAQSANNFHPITLTQPAAMATEPLCPGRTSQRSSRSPLYR